jgi:hypothetical protein
LLEHFATEKEAIQARINQLVELDEKQRKTFDPFQMLIFLVFSHPAIYPNPGFSHSLSLQMFNALSQY